MKESANISARHARGPSAATVVSRGRAGRVTAIMLCFFSTLCLAFFVGLTSFGWPRVGFEGMAVLGGLGIWCGAPSAILATLVCLASFKRGGLRSTKTAVLAFALLLISAWLTLFLQDIR